MSDSKPRNTRQREVILEILRESGSALSAEELWKLSKAQLPNLALTTVYRNLDRLLEAHLIQPVFLLEGGAARYIPSAGHKHHMVCVKCDRTVDLPDCPLEAVETELEKETGFIISGHSLEIYGYCDQCRKAMETDAAQN